MPELILHHYPGSPFAEKLRLIFGFKRLAWTSVLQPVIMPKPELTALTGGYRRIPVLQVGADVYCDTALIARRLEEAQPEPTVFPASAPLAPVLAQWADSTLFWTAVPFTMRPETMAEVLGDTRPEVMRAFGADRAAFSAGFKRPSARDAAVLLPLQLAHLDAQLADGRPWLLGAEASIADFAVAHPLWFVQRAASLGAVFDPHPALRAWLARVLDIGHGTPTHLAAADAVALAAATPDHAPAAVAAGMGFEQGQTVVVAAADYGSDPVAGTLVGLQSDEIVLRRIDPRAGTVHVHFPRAGYQLKAHP
jgi:glutathione S-transferase